MSYRNEQPVGPSAGSPTASNAHGYHVCCCCCCVPLPPPSSLTALAATVVGSPAGCWLSSLSSRPKVMLPTSLLLLLTASVVPKSLSHQAGETIDEMVQLSAVASGSSSE